VFSLHRESLKLIQVNEPLPGVVLSQKADRSLFDPIMKLQADCPGIQVYLHISLA
jgi:hypothetical protein